jgi:hypothetical protein
MGWDGMGWDGMGWDGMGWDGMGWDGMGWDGMGWAAVSAGSLRGHMPGPGIIVYVCAPHTHFVRRPGVWERVGVLAAEECPLRAPHFAEHVADDPAGHVGERLVSDRGVRVCIHAEELRAVVQHNF